MQIKLCLSNGRKINLPFDFSDEEINELKNSVSLQFIEDEPLTDEENQFKEKLINWFNSLPQKIIDNFTEDPKLKNWKGMLAWYLSYQEAADCGETIRHKANTILEGQAYLGYRYFTEKEILEETLSLYLYDEERTINDIIQWLDEFYQPEKYQHDNEDE